MPATPARAAFLSEEFRSRATSAIGVRNQYGKVARDTGDAPVPTYFDSMDAVQVYLDERFALVSAHARMFRVAVAGLIDVDTLLDMSETVPVATLIDDELNANMAVAVIGIEEYDLDAETTTLICWGTV